MQSLFAESEFFQILGVQKKDLRKICHVKEHLKSY